MRNRNLLPILFAILIGLVALALVVAAFLPYGTLKALADALKSNGNFKSLKESNALVFRILVGSAGLVLFGIAYLLGFGHLKDVRAWFSRFLADFLLFLKALKPTKIEWVSLAALLWIIGLAAFFRLIRIQNPMTHDESYTYMVFSSTSLFNIITNYQLPNNHVLNSILIFFSTHLFGIQPWTVRLPALLAGLLCVPACYTLARAIYDKYTALASALLVAVLPGAILYSTTGRGYSLVALFTLLTLWLATYVRREKNLFAWSLLVLFSALGFYSVPVMLFPFGVVFAWLFLENLVTVPEAYTSKIDFLKYWLVAGFSTAVLVLLLYTPIFIYTGAAKVFANHWVQPEAWNGYLASIPGRVGAVWFEWTNGTPPILSLLPLAGILLGLILYPRIARQRFPLPVAAFLWITALLLIQRPIGVEKIWVFLQAPGAIWAAAGVMGLLKELQLRFRRSISAAAILIGIALALTTARAVQIVPGLPEHWAIPGPTEKTVLFLKDQLAPHDLIIIDSPYDASVWYYSLQYGIPEKRFDQRQPFDRLFVIVSHTDGQTVESVLHDRGPDPTLVDPTKTQIIFNTQNLDIYVVPHR